MAKQSGLGANLYMAEFDLSGDVGAVSSISSPRGVLVVTGISKSAPERILALRDGALGFNGFWNEDVGQIHEVLSAMPTTDVLTTMGIPAAASAFAVGDVGCALSGKQMTFDIARGQDASLAVTSNVMANGTALEWGRLLTAGKATRATGTVNGDSVDAGAATDLGCAAYLHVFAMASGTMGVKLQDSANNTDFDDLAGMAFTNVTGPTSERIVSGLADDVRRYVRLVTTGTHATATLAVLFVRYETNQAI